MSPTQERLSWLPPDQIDRVRAALLAGRASWEEVFDGDAVKPVPKPDGVGEEAWPRMAAHVARAERVREVIRRAGLEEAGRRFGGSQHAVERGALLEASGELDLAAVKGILACEIDEHVAYGQFLGKLVELGLPADPRATVMVYEWFVTAASAVVTDQPSWPERLRVARDGLAQVYVKVGRHDDAERLYGERFAEEPADTTIAIGAGRAFLEAGATGRALAWLERGADRARELGRGELEARLREKVVALRGRAN